MPVAEMFYPMETTCNRRSRLCLQRSEVNVKTVSFRVGLFLQVIEGSAAGL